MKELALPNRMKVVNKILGTFNQMDFYSSMKQPRQVIRKYLIAMHLSITPHHDF